MLPPDALWQALQDERPLAARLAMLTCLPVRVSPAFLRLARLRLAAEAGTGDEADLWLSDLVETRASAGLSYRRGARELLRQKLAAEPTVLDAVWTQVHLAHAPWLPARSQLEEELTWRLLRDPGDTWIDERWRALLKELESGSNPEGVARWVVRAVPDLPPGALDFESGRRAYYGASLLLGDASVLGTEVQTFLDTNQFAFATRRLPRRRIHVARVEGGLLLSSLQPIEQGFELDVPATRPLWLQVEGNTGEGGVDAQVITLAEHEALTCPTASDRTSLRLIDGSAYSIGPVRSTSQKFVARMRAPRVQIKYERETYGVNKLVQLPFVMGVMADLTGRRAEPLPPVAERKFLEVDIDNFDARMKSMKPRAAFKVLNRLTGEGNFLVDITFESMEDFSPDAVAAKVDGLKQLLEARQQLANLMTYMDGKPDAEALMVRLIQDKELLASLAASKAPTVEGSRDRPPRSFLPPTDHDQATKAESNAQVANSLEGTTLKGTDLSALLSRGFRAHSDETKAAVEQAVIALAQQALANTQVMGNDVFASIEAMIAELDQKLSDQVNPILHNPEFQQLEGAWRGLHYLVNNTETDEMLKIRVLNISKTELGKTLRRFKGEAWDQSPVFKKVYTEEFEMLGGQPFGCLVGDYQFDHTPPDIELLGEMAKLAAAAHAPFIAAASPSVMQMSSWQELVNPRDLTKIFTTLEYAAWRSLRESEDARYIGLTMPRYLSRLPYGAKTHPVEGFNFEEYTGKGDDRSYAWSNSAYAMAVNINRSFKLYGWCASIRGVEGGGAVAGLPTHAFPTDDGGMDMKGPTEIAITDRREAEMAKNGFMPFIHLKNSDFAAFIGAQSLQKPIEHDDLDAAATANLAARLPYMFVCSRFAHYLKCIVRDKIGGFADHASMERYLTNWILNYVYEDPDGASQEIQAMRPLAGAQVEVKDLPDNPRYYSATLYLRPYYQLEGLTHLLQLRTLVPSQRQV